MLEKCDDAKRILFECINEMRDYFNSANRVYKYCLQWLIAMVKHKAKVDLLEEELNSMGKTFVFLSDKDGEQREKVNSLQVELLYLQRQKEDYVSVFWKVEEIFEAKIEHFLVLLGNAVKYERNLFAPKSFSHTIDVLVECISLFVSIKLVVQSWKVLLSEIKDKYKQIFQKKSS